MDRINTVDGLFHEGNPATGEKGTKVTADWLNALQETVINLNERWVVAHTYPTLAAADAAAVAAGKPLLVATLFTDVPTGLAADVTIIPGRMLKPSGQVAISGSFTAGLHQVFDLSGGGSIVFGPNSIHQRPQEWFGPVSTFGTGGPNIIQGHPDNHIESGGNSISNTIAGGGGGYQGAENRIDGAETRYAVIGGGYDNHINGAASTEELDCASSTISGGAHNVIQSTHCTISGGSYNTIGAGSQYSAVSGGSHNTIAANRPNSGIWGGVYNTVSGVGSFAAGNNVTVTQPRSMALSTTTYTLDASDSFGGAFSYWFLTGGKVGIGAYNAAYLPQAQLDIYFPGSSDTSGEKHMIRLGSRFGFRVMNNDHTMVLDRYNGGWADPVMSWSRLTGRVGVGMTALTSPFNVANLPQYADNAAALTGGLSAGAFYRTATGVLMVVY